ncbi:MAG: sigma-70 family RNA polymerase sigma factor [Clostridia bacterium]|nr:sigma-70 family RNA polymerase sigma factor [Clostridia bacterium]
MTLTKEEFIRQVEENRGAMYRVTCAYLRQEHDRLDAVQEALLKAWQGLPWLREAAYFRTWLIRILIRECVNIQRRQKRVIPTESVPEPPREENSADPALREAILALPESMRIVVVLFYMEGYPVEDISRILKLPKGTVCSRLARAREKIKQAMKEEAEC